MQTQLNRDPPTTRSKRAHKAYKSNFLENLYAILNTDAFKPIIDWTEDGTCFTIIDTRRFESIVLPRYYKHNNIKSFTRQLHMYRFQRKNEGKECGGLIFSNIYFQRGQPELLKNIQRNPEKMKKPPVRENEYTESEEPELLKKQFQTQFEVQPQISTNVENPAKDNEVLAIEHEMNQMQEKVNQMLEFCSRGCQDVDSEGTISRSTTKEKSEGNMYRNFRHKLEQLLGFKEIEGDGTDFQIELIKCLGIQ